jgi:hypothetical protein
MWIILFKCVSCGRSPHSSKGEDLEYFLIKVEGGIQKRKSLDIFRHWLITFGFCVYMRCTACFCYLKWQSQVWTSYTIFLLGKVYTFWWEGCGLVPCQGSPTWSGSSGPPSGSKYVCLVLCLPLIFMKSPSCLYYIFLT